MISKVRSLKSRIKTRPALEDIITSTNDVLSSGESTTMVEIWKLRNLSWKTVKSYVIV